MGITYWKALSDVEVTKLKRRRDAQLESGEIEETSRRTRSDKGKKRSHHSSNGPSRKKYKSAETVNDDNNDNAPSPSSTPSDSPQSATQTTTATITRSPATDTTVAVDARSSATDTTAAVDARSSATEITMAANTRSPAIQTMAANARSPASQTSTMPRGANPDISTATQGTSGPNFDITAPDHQDPFDDFEEFMRSFDSVTTSLY